MCKLGNSNTLYVTLKLKIKQICGKKKNKILALRHAKNTFFFGLVHFEMKNYAFRFCLGK